MKNLIIPSFKDETATAIKYGLITNLFTPQFRYEKMRGAEEHAASTVEFAAYRLGEVDENLGSVIAIMERGTDQSSQTPS